MNKPKVKQISDTLFEVLGKTVKIQTKRGRTLLLCSCQNHSRFCNENPFCYHKQLVLEYLNLKEVRKEVNRLIEFYELQKGIKSKISAEVILDDLITLKRKYL